MVYIIPCLIIESLNVLFNLNIDITLKTWFAVFILTVVFGRGAAYYDNKT